MPSHEAQLYRGRFAPSPTGPVHFGTLIAAVASYLQAKKNNGEWLIRIEDVDTTRKVEGADTEILHTLEAFGFQWHGEIIYQSGQTQHYQQALDELIAQSRIFPCTCTRKQLAASNSDVYPGTCRHRRLPESKEHSLRLLIDDIDIEFTDAIMGRQSQNIQQQCGDFVVRRRDGLFAYQLAVVVDDALQGITQIVRGADLLDSTARQIFLQRLLHYPTPDYCHLPLATDTSGKKISKSEGGARVELSDKEALLIRTLDFLGQHPPAHLSGCNCDDIWHWAETNWNLASVPRKPTIVIEGAGHTETFIQSHA